MTSRLENTSSIVELLPLDTDEVFEDIDLDDENCVHPTSVAPELSKTHIAETMGVNEPSNRTSRNNYEPFPLAEGEYYNLSDFDNHPSSYL